MVGPSYLHLHLHLHLVPRFRIPGRQLADQAETIIARVHTAIRLLHLAPMIFHRRYRSTNNNIDLIRLLPTGTRTIQAIPGGYLVLLALDLLVLQLQPIVDHYRLRLLQALPQPIHRMKEWLVAELEQEIESSLLL